VGIGQGAVESLVMNREFWQGKQVFLTGHTGFKGSWLSLWLQDLGAMVTGYALAPDTSPNLFELAKVATGMNSVIGDIRDYKKMKQTLLAAKPEIVLHLAAQPLVRYSYSHPRETYETNVIGTVNLLDAMRECPSVRAAVNVTSDKCYEDREWDKGYREDDPMGGHDPYSSSKGCAELVTTAFRKSYFPPERYAEHHVALASARAGNVIGGGDWSEDRLIPDFIRAIAANLPLRIRNPHAIRPWQHVMEPLAGYLLLAERLTRKGATFASAWNFGPAEEDAREVQWIADRLMQQWGQNATWQLDGDDHPHEVTYLKLDASRARDLLGWQPKLHLDEAIDLLAAWYKAANAGENMRAFTLNQIRQYAA
jgi:CDP-glucose 4,6-dehydratase